MAVAQAAEPAFRTFGQAFQVASSSVDEDHFADAFQHRAAARPGARATSTAWCSRRRRLGNPVVRVAHIEEEDAAQLHAAQDVG